MGFLNFLKKESVPDELPKLATDEISEKDTGLFVDNQTPVVQQNTEILAKPAVQTSELEKPLEKPNAQTEVIKDFQGDIKEKDTSRPEIYQESVEPAPMEGFKPKREEIHDDLSKKLPANDNDESFFTELKSNINKEISNLDKLESWYKNKFLPKDIVNEMRKHWEGKKNSSVIKILGKNFKDRISERTTKLQELEREWQDIYFDLIEKEEEIRQQERELKKMLSEFVELCKRKNKEKQGKK